MAGLVLDTGGLIAHERDDRKFWVAYKSAVDLGLPVVVPAPVVAQVWRSQNPAKLARLLNAVEVVPMDLAVARQAGRLCGEAGTSDVVDAMVAILANERGFDVVTSDVPDIKRLLDVLKSTSKVLQV